MSVFVCQNDRNFSYQTVVVYLSITLKVLISLVSDCWPAGFYSSSHRVLTETGWHDSYRVLTETSTWLYIALEGCGSVSLSDCLLACCSYWVHTETSTWLPSTYRDQYFGEGGGRRHMGPPLVFFFILI